MYARSTASNVGLVGVRSATSGSLTRWVAHVQEVKPGARMPSYERLDPQTLADLGDWLGSLQ